MVSQLTRLIKENEALRAQNREFQEKWLRDSTSTLNFQQKEMAFLEKYGLSIESDSNENMNELNNKEKSGEKRKKERGDILKDERKDEIYDKVREVSGKKGKRRKSWDESLQALESDESLNRTTLRKRLHNSEGEARERYSRYAEIEERKRYCQLI